VKVFLAGVDRLSFLPLLWNNGARRILINYWDWRNRFHKLIPELQKYNFEVLLDSGAYVKAAKINVKDYAEFLGKYKDYFCGYFNLDSLYADDNVAVSMDNQEYLESQGLTPIPVYHFGEPIEVLHELLHSHSHIGIGGCARKSSNTVDAWLKTLELHRYSWVQWHVLGITAKSVLENNPSITSVDSTKWLVGRRFGMLVNESGVGQTPSKLGNDEMTKINIEWHLKLEVLLHQSKGIPMPSVFPKVS